MDYCFDDFLLNADFDEDEDLYAELPTLRQVFQRLADADPCEVGKVQLLSIWGTSGFLDPTAGTEYGDLEHIVNTLPYTNPEWFDMPARIVESHPEALEVADTIVLVYTDAYEVE